jgi:hypothetical protein
VLGLDLEGMGSAESVELSGPFSGLGVLELAGATVELRLGEAAALGRYSGSAEVAAAMNTLGAGRAVTFGFDISRVSPSQAASSLLSRAVEAVVPLTTVSALGVTPIEVTLENLGSPVELRVTELLSPPLVAVATSPEGTMNAERTIVEWVLGLQAQESAVLRTLVRLPDAVGEQSTLTEVTVLTPSGERLYAELELELTVHADGASLLQGAVTAVGLLPQTGHDGSVRRKLEEALARIQARPIGSRADIEANLADILAAIEDARKLKTVSPALVRTSLAELVRYWEARWFVF